MELTQQNVEKLALGNIINGFNNQSLGMPSIYLRFLEIEDEFTEEDIKESMDLYQDIMKSKTAGHNLSIAMLAAYYIIAELTLQHREHLNEIINATINVPEQSLQGYG
uniref:Uncharacterized protein n=1 Tax=viral metagenome TaxID=1070528 RepID=A0A6M3LS69_9ZZZZ